MIKVSDVEVFGWKAAIRGMRNPMNSWDRIDSDFGNSLVIGENDLSLMKKLIVGGPEHRKFLRMIHVQFDLDAPRYFWSEFDTYHFNTKNSCSTMHKLLSKTPITLDSISYDKEDESSVKLIVDELNKIRLEYLDTKNVALIRRAKQLLPEGFYQKRTIDTNYEELLNMYHQRHNHRLPEWRTLCEQMLSLPYFEEFLKAKESKM